MYTVSGTSGSGEPNAPNYQPADASAPPPSYGNAPPPSYGGEGSPGQQPPPVNNYNNPPPPNQGYQPPNTAPNTGYQNYNQPPPNSGYSIQPKPIAQHTYVAAPPQINNGQQAYIPPRQMTPQPVGYVPHPTTNVTTGPPRGKPKYTALAEYPVQTTCRNCNEYVTTVVDSGPDCGTCAVCCLVSICMCPICGIAACCWPKTWGHTHQCPKCKYIMGTKDAFGPHYAHNR